MPIEGEPTAHLWEEQLCRMEQQLEGSRLANVSNKKDTTGSANYPHLVIASIEGESTAHLFEEQLCRVEQQLEETIIRLQDTSSLICQVVGKDSV